VQTDGGASAIAAIVGTVCVLLAIASWRALVRTGNPRIYYVVAAFSVMALKNVAKAFTLGTTGETPPVELLFSLADLAAVLLFAWPLLRSVGVPR
jgi:hypothetical protein